MPKSLTLTLGFALCLTFADLTLAASIKDLQSEPSKEVSARGVLRAGETVDLTATLSERLVELPYKLGEYFKAGALLAKFDCELQEAELTALMKQHQTQRVKHKAALKLFQYGAAGKLDVSLAEAEMQQALAEADIVQTRLKDCSLYAPFSGYVAARHISAFETPQMGQKIYSLERAKSAELSIIVPSTWMTWIEKGQALDFTIDATKESFDAKIVRLGVSVDPVSQTYEIIAKPAYSPKALMGMSGVARFKDAP